MSVGSYIPRSEKKSYTIDVTVKTSRTEVRPTRTETGTSERQVRSLADRDNVLC